jgi:hypothetical protein
VHGQSLAAQFGPDVHAPDVSLVALLFILAAEKAGSACELAIFKISQDKIERRVSSRKFVSEVYDRGRQMFLG